MLLKRDEEPVQSWIIELQKTKKQNKKRPFMTSKFKRNRSRQQAKLKLTGQKIFNIDDQGGFLSNLGGLLPAARLAEDTGLIQTAANLIPEWRDSRYTDFPVDELLLQRVLLAACGQPDAIDCSIFRNDPALKCALGREPDGPPLASQSTHTKFEQSIDESTIASLEGLPLKFFIQQQKHAPQRLTVYVDGTAIQTFGSQQMSTWRGGKYSQSQYFPLLATTDQGDLLLAELRSGGYHDARSAETVVKLVCNLRAAWPNIKLTIVMDTGFNSPRLLEQLEKLNVQYVIGYPAMSSVKSKIKDITKSAEKQFKKLHGEPLYIGKGSKKKWQKEHERIRSLPGKDRIAAEKKAASRHTRIIYGLPHNGSSWKKDRPVLVRVDYTDKGLDIRCVVTNIEDSTAEQIYEEKYCRRSRIEMFIKENKSHCKVPLSCQTFTANQYRFTAIQGLAYMLLHMVRKELPASQKQISLNSVRNRFLLVPVQIISTPRRLCWRLSSVHPHTATVISMCKKLQSRTA